MDQDNIVDLVIEKKGFLDYKVISRGRFSATIEIDCKKKDKKTAVLILRKKESENKRFYYENINNAYIVQAVQYEYMTKLQTFLIYTETSEYTLKDKIENKDFRKSPGAIESVLDWIKEVTLGLKKLHSQEYVHLNIKTSSIMITSDNRAKIGSFNFARHTSTENKSSEVGCETYYQPPETFSKFEAITGKKFDSWSLGMLTIEAFTNHKIALKSSETSSWPEQYAILHKILQGKKFKKSVKNQYSKATRDTYSEGILSLVKHSLKFFPEERPDVSQFLLLLLELIFLKRINKQVTEEKIWEKKVPLNELAPAIKNMGAEKKGSRPNKKTENKYDEFGDQMILQKTDETEKVEISQANTTLDIDKTEIHNDVLNSESAKSAKENIQEKKQRSKFTMPTIFGKVMNWAFEENFYIGVKHSESFINQLSKSLTG